MVRQIFIIIAIFISFSPYLIYAEGTEERVFDQAALFSQSEKEQLENLVQSMIQHTELDIAIVTADDVQGKSSADYAHDFYNEHSLGYGSTADGLLYLINMDDREVYIYMRDRGYDYFDDSRIDKVLDQVVPYLSDGQYAKSAETFLHEAERRVLTEGIVTSPDGEEEGSIWTEFAIYLGISVVAGGAVIVVMILGNRGRSTVHEGTYLKDGSFQVTNRMDQYYTTTVTRQRIQRNRSGGSGPRIGGGGRSF